MYHPPSTIHHVPCTIADLIALGNLLILQVDKKKNKKSLNK